MRWFFNIIQLLFHGRTLPYALSNYNFVHKRYFISLDPISVFYKRGLVLYKETNRKIRYAQCHLRLANIASDFTCAYCAATGTIFGTTDVWYYTLFLIISKFSSNSISSKLVPICQSKINCILDSSRGSSFFVNLEEGDKCRLQIRHLHFCMISQKCLLCYLKLQFNRVALKIMNQEFQ